MKSLSNKGLLFSDSIIRGMTHYAEKFNAINLSQGYPEFDPPKEILDCLNKIVYEKNHQYPVSYGSRNIRIALAEKQKKFTNLDIDYENEITITCGGTEAMVATMLSIVNKGDKIGIFTPIYENYKTACILADAEPVYIPLNPPEYKFDFNNLEDVFKQGIKAIIVCNPSNPSGRVFTLEELTVIADLAKKYDTYVITDEVYEHMVYRPHKMTYISTLPNMKERTIVCSSLSKTYAITGWRIGYTIAPKRITDVIKKVHNFLTIAAPSVLQEAVTVGLKFDSSYYDNLLDKYSLKRDIICNGLDDIGIKYHKPEGTYFVLMELEEFMKKFNIDDDVEFAKMICEKYGVAFVPASGFFVDNGKTKGIFRLHFAKYDKTLYDALNRISDMKKCN